jgi:hypothetical protein
MNCNHRLLAVCERIGRNESFLTLAQMVEDRKILRWFVDLLFKHKNMAIQRRVWPVTLMYGHFRSLPILYAYLSDMRITETQRTFKITFMDWQRNTHGVVDVTLVIYPELLYDGYYMIRQQPKIKHKHTCAMKSTSFGPDRHDFCTDVSDCMNEVVWLLDAACEEAVYNVVQTRKIMRMHRAHSVNNAVFSTRLLSVLMYACRLQKAIGTYIRNNCSCDFKGTDCCKCLSLCLTIRDHFPEAALLQDDVVLFKA